MKQRRDRMREGGKMGEKGGNELMDYTQSPIRININRLELQRETRIN